MIKSIGGKVYSTSFNFKKNGKGANFASFYFFYDGVLIAMSSDIGNWWR